MGILAPGVAQGALDAMQGDRQRVIDQQLEYQRKQAMAYQAWQQETARAQQARQLQANQNVGATLGGMYPAPPPVAPQAQGGGALAPAPGTPSMPMQPQGQPQAMAPTASPGSPPPPQSSMRPPIPPYRSLAAAGQPQPQGQPQGQGAPAGGVGAPPPVQPAAQPQPTSLLQKFVQAMRNQGIPPEQWADNLEAVQPALKMQMADEMEQLKSQNVQFGQQMKGLEFELKRIDEERKAGKDQRQGDQADRRLDLSAQRLAAAKTKAAAGAAPGSSDLDDPVVARFWYDRFKQDDKSPPFAMGDKAGRAAWRKAVVKFAREDAMGGGDIAASQGAYKGDVSTYRQLDQKLAAIEGQTGALEKVDKNIIPLFKKLNGTFGGQWANQKINDFTSKFGDNKDLQTLKTLATTYGREYQKAVTGAGSNAQMLATHKEDADAMINGNMPLDQVLGAIEGMKIDVKAMRDSISDQKSTIKGSMAGKDGGGAENDPLGIR